MPDADDDSSDEDDTIEQQSQTEIEPLVKRQLSNLEDGASKSVSVGLFGWIRGPTGRVCFYRTIHPNRISF